MSRILVTGASGLIGSRVAQRLAIAGHEVIATARRPTAQLEREIGLRVQRLDVLDPGSDGADADALVHCATANDVLSRDFRAGIELGVMGTRNVLELAARRGIRRMLFLSTVQVYGTELSGTVSEDSPARCETPYALNHLLGEEVCRMHARTDGLEVSLLRPANVYGAPDASSVDRSTLVPTCFVKEAAATGRIALRSSGRQVRNFVSTDEVATACLHLVEHPVPGCQVVNVASRWQASIREVAEQVAAVHRERTGGDLPIEIGADEPDRNEFVLRSRLEFLQPTADESVREMTRVIGRLFDRYA